MRAVLTNVGSTGDIQPFLALAAELRRHGHQPVLAASPTFAPRAERLGIEFAAVGPEMKMEYAHQVMQAMLAETDPAKQLRIVLDVTLPPGTTTYQELRDACRGADVVIGGITQPAAQMVQETTGIPFVSVQLVHIAMPTTYRRPLGLPLPPLPGKLGPLTNRALSQLFARHIRRVCGPVVNRYRAEQGLPALKDPLFGGSSQLTLYAVSRHVARPAPGWPAIRHLAGYFFLDEDEGWQPDPALLDFLADGPPPVVISFGSMMPADSEQLTHLVLEAVRHAGCRAIIQEGWAGLATGDLPANVRSVGFVPHSWLFPRAAAVIQHGGAGTSAAAFRAGIPSVFVPHMADQPVWAAIARELGVSGPPVPFARLTAERLGQAIIATVTNPDYARAAAALGAAIRSEDGVGTARLMIERLVESRSAPSARGATGRSNSST